MKETLIEIKDLCVKAEEKEILKGYENINEKVTMENILSSPMANALDSLNRIGEIIEDGDIEQLNSYFPTKNNSLKEIIEETLQELKAKGDVSDFIVYIGTLTLK